MIFRAVFRAIQTGSVGVMMLFLYFIIAEDTVLQPKQESG